MTGAFPQEMFAVAEFYAIFVTSKKDSAMKWYEKMLRFYERPFGEVPDGLREHVRTRLAAMQSPTPVASVVIIAHNEATRLFSCLWSLSENTASFPVELLVVDNLSTDNTVQVAEALGVRCLSETKKGAGHARQCGLDKARGRYYLTVDADSLYPPRYIERMVRALEDGQTVCSYATLSFRPDGKHSQAGIWCYECIRNFYLKLRNIKRPELCVRGSCMAFRVDEARAAGGFRTDIIRGEDGSLALALKARGKLRFVTSRKARIITNDPALLRGESLGRRLAGHAANALKSIRSLFTSESEYRDEDSNLLK